MAALEGMVGCTKQLLDVVNKKHMKSVLLLQAYLTHSFLVTCMHIHLSRWTGVDTCEGRFQVFLM